MNFNLYRYIESRIHRYFPSTIRWPFDYTKEERHIVYKVTPYTMTASERIVSLVRAVDYISKNKIQGSFVECGVWRGGSMMAAMEKLIACDDTSRDIFLYDTFEGMTPPSSVDVDFSGTSAADGLKKANKKDSRSLWCYSSLDEVKKNISQVSYPSSHINFIKGPVEETLQKRAGIAEENHQKIPEKIALLRLDTDWYESTKVELECLFPRLVTGGILIIDDYGHWKGQRQAVDEYMAAHSIRMFFARIDYGACIGVKM